MTVEGKLTAEIKSYKPYLKESRLAEDIKDTPISVITISGRAGTGKTATLNTLADMIEAHTGKRPEIFKVGDELVRKKRREQTGEEIVGPDNTPIEEHRLIEQIIADKIKAATPDNLLLIEGWTTALNASEVREQALTHDQTPPAIASFLLTARNDERFPRIAKRQGVSIAQAKQRTQERERQNSEKFWELYERVRGIDLFSPNNKDRFGQPIYTVTVDTNTPDYPEVAREMFTWLVKKGTLTRTTRGDIPEEFTKQSYSEGRKETSALIQIYPSKVA